MSAQSLERSGARRTLGRRVARWTIATIAVVAGAWWSFINAAHFLEGPGETPVAADVQVVLGGDSGDRVMMAIHNYESGLAPYVLLTGREHHPVEKRPYYVQWRSRTLMEHGIPADRILFDSEATNSWEEAVNTLRLMKQRGWRRVLVISDPYHMRRLALIYSRVFRGSGLQYTLVASKPDDWDPDHWWMYERKGGLVIMEYIKLAYYLAKH